MPVRRVRHRYLGFYVDSERKYSEDEVWDAVQRSVLYLYGVLGLSETAPKLIEFDIGQRGILRCTHTHVRRLRAALAHITDIGGTVACVHVRGVSGTLRALRRLCCLSPSHA